MEYRLLSKVKQFTDVLQTLCWALEKPSSRKSHTKHLDRLTSVIYLWNSMCLSGPVTPNYKTLHKTGVQIYCILCSSDSSISNLCSKHLNQICVQNKYIKSVFNSFLSNLCSNHLYKICVQIILYQICVQLVYIKSVAFISNLCLKHINNLHTGSYRHVHSVNRIYPTRSCAMFLLQYLPLYKFQPLQSHWVLESLSEKKTPTQVSIFIGLHVLDTNYISV